MKLGIFAKTFKGEVPQPILAAAARAGYASVQYNMACSGIGALPIFIDPAVAQSVRDASQECGVDIAAISATYNMAHPNGAQREAGRRSFAEIASHAKAMGTNLLTVCSGSLDAEDQWRHHRDNDTPAAWRAMIAEFELLIEIADRHDICIGVEPELANIVSTAAKARVLLDTLQSDCVKIVLDPANLFEIASDQNRRAVIEQAVDVLGSSIIMAHAKDRSAGGGFVAAGQGVIDFRHFLDCLQAVGFKGCLVTHGLTASEAPTVAAFLAGTLQCDV
jgi:sugar phosphate isomerase/epimerase